MGRFVGLQGDAQDHGGDTWGCKEDHREAAWAMKILLRVAKRMLGAARGMLKDGKDAQGDKGDARGARGGGEDAGIPGGGCRGRAGGLLEAAGRRCGGPGLAAGRPGAAGAEPRGAPPDGRINWRGAGAGQPSPGRPWPGCTPARTLPAPCPPAARRDGEGAAVGGRLGRPDAAGADAAGGPGGRLVQARRQPPVPHGGTRLGAAHGRPPLPLPLATGAAGRAPAPPRGSLARRRPAAPGPPRRAEPPTYPAAAAARPPPAAPAPAGMGLGRPPPGPCPAPARPPRSSGNPEGRAGGGGARGCHWRCRRGRGPRCLHSAPGCLRGVSCAWGEGVLLQSHCGTLGCWGVHQVTGGARSFEGGSPGNWGAQSLKGASPGNGGAWSLEGVSSGNWGCAEPRRGFTR